MEADTRTVLVVIGVVVMVAILVDGFRRMRRARQEALRLDVRKDYQFPEESFSPELPNGGARVVGELDEQQVVEQGEAFKAQLDDLPPMTALDEMEHEKEQELPDQTKESLHEERIYAGEPEFQTESYAHEPEAMTEPETKQPQVVAETVEPVADVVADEAQVDEAQNNKAQLEEKSQLEQLEQDVEEEIELAEAPEAILPKAKPLNLDEQVPLLMDVEQLGEKEVEIPAADEPQAEQVPAHSDVVIDEVEQKIEQEVELTLDDVEGITANVAEMAAMMDSSAAEQQNESQNEGQHKGLDPAQVAAQAAYAPVKQPGPGAESLADRPAPNLVLVTHVIPHDEDGFCGEDILYLVNSCDLRHGEKDIFHRFEQENGEGKVQFSMANSFNPGTFDPQALLHQRVHGVSLFMSLPGPDKAMDAFEAMTEMASVIARNLGGEVQDETHSVMAMQTIEHNRQQVRDFVRKQKLAKR